MKRTLWTLAAAVALVGCSKEELVNVDDGQLQNGNAIAFSTYVGDNAQTRASVIEIDDLQLNGFGVNAYYTGQDTFSEDTDYSDNAIFMDNTKVTYNPEKGVWTYSPVKYWPNNEGDKLSFFAYAPYSSSQITFDQTNKSMLSFAVDNDVKNQVDLIYHPANGDEYKGCEKTIDLEKPSVNSTINFKFQHALSRITFDVKAVVDETEATGDNLLDGNTRINIRKVQLVAATDDGADPFYTNGILNLADGAWDVTGNENTQSFTFDGDDFYRAVEDNGETVAQLTKFNPAQTLLNEDSYLMIIPQDFSEYGSETTEAYRIYIEYDVISEEVDNDGSSDNTTNDHNTITNKIYSNAMHTTFEAGKAYKFTLLLGMTSVKFNADVAAWDEQENETVWVPENKESVSDADGLNSIIEDGGYAVLDSDITLTDALAVAEGKNVTIDLNGKTLTTASTPNADAEIIVKGKLNVINGTITSNSTALYADGGELVLNNCTIAGNNPNAAAVAANGSTGKIEATNCTTTAANSAYYAFNGAQMTLTNCTVSKSQATTTALVAISGSNSVLTIDGGSYTGQEVETYDRYVIGVLKGAEATINTTVSGGNGGVAVTGASSANFTGGSYSGVKACGLYVDGNSIVTYTEDCNFSGVEGAVVVGNQNGGGTVNGITYTEYMKIQ